MPRKGVYAEMAMAGYEVTGIRMIKNVFRQMYKHRTADGYMTLEAALVFPIVFCLIIMLIYLTFFLYDRCRMTQDCYTAAYHQSILRSRKSGSAEEIDTGNYWMLNQKSASVSGGSSVAGTAHGSMISAMSLRGAVNNKWILKVVRKARKTDPPASFRRYRRILDRVEKIRMQQDD